jgi:hypothetical protein
LRSSGSGGGSSAGSPATRIRQVEQRPRPPHTDACGIPAQRLASSTGPPDRHLYFLAVEIPDADGRAALNEAARRACGECQPEQDPRRPEDRIADLLQLGALCALRRSRLRRQLLGESRILSERDHFAAGLGSAEDCQDGQQHEATSMTGKARAYQARKSQPEVEPDAAMRPGHREKNDLARAAPIILHEVTQQSARVEVHGAVHRVREPRPDDVVSEKSAAPRAPGESVRPPTPRHAQRAAPVLDQPQAEQPMDQQRAEKRCLCDRIALTARGNQSLPASHRAQRDEPERMVAEMRDEVRKEGSTRTPGAPGRIPWLLESVARHGANGKEARRARPAPELSVKAVARRRQAAEPGRRPAFGALESGERRARRSHPSSQVGASGVWLRVTGGEIVIADLDRHGPRAQVLPRQHDGGARARRSISERTSLAARRSLGIRRLARARFPRPVRNDRARIVAVRKALDPFGESCRPRGAAALRPAVRTSTRRSTPSVRSFLAVTGPTPPQRFDRQLLQEFLDALGRDHSQGPSGFCHPDAIFARNLFGATPGRRGEPGFLADPGALSCFATLVASGSFH